MYNIPALFLKERLCSGWQGLEKEGWGGGRVMFSFIHGITFYRIFKFHLCLKLVDYYLPKGGGRKNGKVYNKICFWSVKISRLIMNVNILTKNIRKNTLSHFSRTDPLIIWKAMIFNNKIVRIEKQRITKFQDLGLRGNLAL